MRELAGLPLLEPSRGNAIFTEQQVTSKGRLESNFYSSRDCLLHFTSFLLPPSFLISSSFLFHFLLFPSYRPPSPSLFTSSGSLPPVPSSLFLSSPFSLSSALLYVCSSLTILLLPSSSLTTSLTPSSSISLPLV